MKPEGWKCAIGSWAGSKSAAKQRLPSAGARPKAGGELNPGQTPCWAGGREAGSASKSAEDT